MTMQMVGGVHRNVAVEIVLATQESSNTLAVVSGADIDMRPWRSLSYTIEVADENTKWTVYAANTADFSDEVVVNAEATVNAGESDSYSVAQAPYAYYRVKIEEAVAGGTAIINGIAKG